MLASVPPTLYLIAIAALIALAAAVLVVWLLVGHAPRRGRAYRKALRQLHAGDWEAALGSCRLWKEAGRLSTQWVGKLRNLEGECLKLAGDHALRDHQYEAALQRHVAAAELLSLDPQDMRNLVIERILSAVR